MLVRRRRPLLLLAFAVVSLVLLAIFAAFWSAFERARRLDEMSSDMRRLESAWSNLQTSTQALLLEDDLATRFGSWKEALDRFDHEFDGLQAGPAAHAMRDASPDYRAAEERARSLWAANRIRFIELSDHLSFLLESAPTSLTKGGRPLLLWREGELASPRGIYYHRTTIDLGLAMARFNRQYLTALEDAIHLVEDEIERLRWRIPLSVIGLISVSLLSASLLLWLVLRSYLLHESTFRSLTSNSLDLIAGFDLDGRIAVVNAALSRLAGRTPPSLIGSGCDALGLPAAEATRLDSAVRAVLADGKPRQELLAWGEASAAGRYECSIFAEIGPAGRITGAFAVARDISQRIQLEEQLRQSEKMRVIGQLAGGVAHDFNNMLAGILGASDLLAKRLANQPEHHRLLEMISSQSVRAAGLTRKLLSFARQQPVIMAVIDLNRPVRDALELQRTSLDPRIVVELDLAADGLPILGDQVQLENAALNLLINAGHAMPEGGRLRVSTRRRNLDAAAAAALAPAFTLSGGTFAELEVVDSGCGIDPAVISRIFEPFFTTKAPGKGTGLGLSAVLGTMQQHGGAIAVESVPGRGSTFRLLLPLSAGAQHAESARPAPAVGDGARILLVDDEEAIRLTVTDILSAHGYTVSCAADGAEALAVFRKDPAAFALVILDMMMPVMDGRSCCTAMRAIDPEARIIIASGYSTDADRVDAGECAVARIDKPYRSEDLLRLIAEALRR